MRLVIAMMLLMATAAPSGAQRFVRDWNQLSPEEQQRLRQNYDMYRNQNPAQRQQFNEQYRRWRSGRH